MFILKRQDVDIKNIQHPTKDQKIPVLSYQGQTFRLLSVFNAAQEEEARALWRDLTDNRGKACVLLEEPERFSVWGKVRLEQLDAAEGSDVASGSMAAPFFIQACLLLLQALYIDIEDLLGDKQAALFRKDVADTFVQWHFPQVESAKSVDAIFTIDPLAMTQMPAWQEHHLQTLLQELHRIGKSYFGNANFTERAMEALEDLPPNHQQQFSTWLNQSPNGKLWQ
ncbi:Npun_F0813 family protein [Almyronema epifaneia]|uniref:Npun_F0813 family protein n=1 Tax=Almyronema epifaneia S1 TaxID=2991925 RepID=A0ABW6IJ88_9CYAN